MASFAMAPARAGVLGMVLSAITVAQTPAQFVLRAPPAVVANGFERTTMFDADGDLDLDVLGTLPLFGSLRLLRNNGAGRFVDVTATHLPVLPNSIRAVVPLDFDGDGDLDLFAGGVGPGVLLRNLGGAFVVAATLSNASGTVAGAAADLDGDADLDLVLGGSVLASGQDLVLVNDGTGTFTVGMSFGFDLTAAVATADLDGDQDADFVFCHLGGLRLFRNNGGLAFTDITATHVVMPTGLALNDMAAGDLDGDGDTDLIVGVNGGPSDLVLQNQGGMLVAVGGLPAHVPSSSLALGDIDRDGDLDLVRSHPGNPLSLVLNDGQAGFADAPARLPATPVFSTNVRLADLDCDGDPEIVTCFFGTPTLLLWNLHLELDAGAAGIGQTWVVDVFSQPGYATLDHLTRLAVGLVRLPQALVIPGLGPLWLDLSFNTLLVESFIPAATGQRAFAFSIPNAPPLIGIELHVQAVIEQLPGPARLTCFDSVVIQ